MTGVILSGGELPGRAVRGVLSKGEALLDRAFRVLAAFVADMPAAAPVSGPRRAMVAAPPVVSRSGQTRPVVLLPPVVAIARSDSSAVLAGSGT
jgi:hypothetical protein